jgi:hypothetical protein
MIAIALSTDEKFTDDVHRRLTSATKRTYGASTVSEAHSLVTKLHPVEVLLLVDAGLPDAMARINDLRSPKVWLVVATEGTATLDEANVICSLGADAVISKRNLDCLDRLVLGLRRRGARAVQ